MTFRTDRAVAPKGAKVIAMVSAAVALGTLAAPASAFYFATRFVERIGSVDIPLGSSTNFAAGSTHRIRMQFGVFDDASGPAPAGGYAGWNAGTIDVTGSGVWSRTPGRIAPFTFFHGPNANGSPLTDPFTSLTQVDNTVGPQPLPWFCGPDGQPLPMPQPVIRGRNTFVSTYEVSVQIPSTSEGDLLELTIGGHWVALNRWASTGPLTMPPDCESGEPGVAHWDPVLGPGTQGNFTSSLQINVVPTPGAAGALLIGIISVSRRRR